MVENVSGWQLSRIKHFEGFRGDAYLCPASVWTIGYGHTKGVKKGMTISRDAAEVLLRKDLMRYENYVHRLLTWQPKQWQFDALTDHTFNIGSIYGGLKREVLRQNHLQVAHKLSLYNKARVGGKLRILPGLVRRANERKMRYLHEVGP